MKPRVLNLTMVIAIAAAITATGCANQGSEAGASRTYSPQEALGVGIVQGTLGAQSAVAASRPSATSVKVQVLAIEGGAYVVRDIEGQESRLPLDENTTIDRPAHVGDWVGAYLDSGGRATTIRNIDKEMGLER